MTQYHYDVVTTTFGNFYILDSNKGLHFILKNNDPRINIIKSSFAPKKTLHNPNIKKIFINLCKGKKINDKIKIYFLIGTKLQKKVWKTLQSIKRGTTISYSDMANKVLNKNAVRAVASAVGKNPISIVLPCHRVIAKDGSIGGYVWGLNMKAKLLDIEVGGTADSICRGGK